MRHREVAQRSNRLAQLGSCPRSLSLAEVLEVSVSSPIKRGIKPTPNPAELKPMYRAMQECPAQCRCSGNAGDFMTLARPGQQALPARRAGYTLGICVCPFRAGAEVRVIGEVREVIAGGSGRCGTEQKVRICGVQATCRLQQGASQAARGRPHLGASSSNGMSYHSQKRSLNSLGKGKTSLIKSALWPDELSSGPGALDRAGASRPSAPSGTYFMLDFLLLLALLFSFSRSFLRSLQPPVLSSSGKSCCGASPPSPSG